MDPFEQMNEQNISPKIDETLNQLKPLEHKLLLELNLESMSTKVVSMSKIYNNRQRELPY